MSEYTSTELLDLVAERGKRIAELENDLKCLEFELETDIAKLQAENQRLKTTIKRVEQLANYASVTDLQLREALEAK